jgi:DNA methylase
MKSRIPKTHRRPRPSAPNIPDDGSPVADGVDVHVGDARLVLPTLALETARTVVITDPPWPEAPADLLTEWGVTDCAELVAVVLALCAQMARRLVVVLGCSTDPRILRVPTSMPFVRACWLRLALPSPRGTILNSGDIAYVFGSMESAEDLTLLPGECTAHTPRAREDEGARMHPCARRLEHMRWLVRHFTHPSDTVLDPFAGSGTTLLAARDAGRRSIGIEAHAPYMAAMRARFRQLSLIRP